MTKTFGLVMVALLAVAGGCGGEGEESAATGARTVTVTETSGTPTTGTTTAGPTKSEAQALVKSMLLRLSDFPTGWRGEPHEEQEGCAGIDKLGDRFDVLADADSDDFAKGDSTEAGSTAWLFRDEETARNALNYVEGSVQSEHLRKCLADFFREQANAGVTVGEVHVGQVSFPKLGDRSSAWEVVIPVESEGVSVTVYLDVVYIRGATALGVVLFSDVFSPFDETEREQLARVVADRMDASLADLP